MMTCGNSSLQKNMTNMIRMKFLVVIAISFLTLSAAVVIAISYPRSQKYELSVYRVSSGWGYDIGFKGKVIIHQPFIPVLPGNAAFPDRASACAAGRLVIKKLSAGECPSLEKDEILGLTDRIAERGM